MAKTQGLNGFRPKLISIAVASCFVTGTALANPTAPTVVYGSAAFQQSGNLLKVTNSPSAIINWQSFSIGAGEITRFIQQSQSSSVLNRVTGAAGVIDPSVILGALQSNGRVYLINPSGILFGVGAQVDVAGLVASSLNLTNADFLANRLKFAEAQGAGAVVNQGNINTSSGGNVYLVGSAVTNSGIITSPQGQVVLAAGNSVELVDSGTPNLRVEITAPDNQAVNLGQVVADAGRIGIYAGLINNSGTLRASSAVAEGGKILLKATKNVTLESSSILDASGVGGGTIEVLSKNGGSVNIAGRLDASAPTSGNGGFIDTSADTFRIAKDTVVTTAAPNGKTGNWLIDPTNIWIAVDQAAAYGAGMFCCGDSSADSSAYGGGPLVQASGAVNDSFLSTGNLQTALGSTSITVSTANANAAAYGSGNITVVSPVSWSSNSSLTLLANADITVNAAISTTGTGNISLYSGWNGGSTSVPVVSPFSGYINLYAPITTAGNVALVAGNQIYQSSTAPVTANRLLAMADGGEGLSLDSATNMVNFLAARTSSTACCGSGYINFLNGKALAVDSVTIPSGTVNGITAYDGSIDINVTSGVLTINQPVSASGNSTGASVYLSGADGVVINSAVSAQTANNPGSGSFADGSSVNVNIDSFGYGGNIDVKAGASVSASAGSGGTANAAYGGNVSARGGSAQVTLSAANGIVVNGGVSAIAGNSGSAITTSGYADAYGSYAQVNLYGNAGGITGSGSVTATGGQGGTATAGGLTFTSNATGGYGDINISSVGQITLGGLITATGKAGGNASGSDYAYASGGSPSVNISSGTGLTLNGTVSATGGAGGTASATTSHYADGGSGYIHVGAPGAVTTAAMVATAGAGGPGVSPRVGGYAQIVIDGGEGGSSGSAGAIQIGGNLTAMGGSGTSGGGGGSAYVYAEGTSVNLLSGKSIVATAGGGAPVGLADVEILSAGNVTLGGNITTSGENASDDGIYITAGNSIIGAGGVLRANKSGSNFPFITLNAVNGIGTQAAPIRLYDGAEATSPELYLNNSSSGNVAVSFVSGDVEIVNDLGGLLNGNASGTYFITAESGNFLLATAFEPNFLPLGAGQSVWVAAPAGNVTIAQGAQLAGSIVTGTGTITLQAGNTVTTDVGTQLTGSVINVTGASIASAGNVNGGATITATATGALDITGGSFTAPAINLQGSSVTSNGALTGGPVNATASGDITLSQSPGIVLGQLSSGTFVTVTSSGGAITNGTGGTNVIAPSLVLNAAAGIGSVAAPIGTQVSGMALNSSGGEIGVSNSGDLTLGNITFGGTSAQISTTGTMPITGTLSAPAANLTLNAGNGMVVLNDVTVGGDLVLSSGIGDMGFDGVSVSGNNVTLNGNNIFVGFQTSTAPTTVAASNLLTATSAGNLNVLGGANSGANALLEGMNVNLTVGTTAGFLNIADLGNGATAQIHSVSPTTITVNFPTLGAGGYFVNGVEGAITDGSTGFFAGGQPAVLDQNLVVTYGMAPPPTTPPTTPPAPPVTPDETPPAVDEAVNQVVASTNQQADEKPQEKVVTNTDPKEGEKDKKDMAVCK